jgi:AbrB family looped-hinge helix DNA binding protein
MGTVTLSPKFQVVIPQPIRKALHLTPGEKLRVPHFSARVEFIPEAHAACYSEIPRTCLKSATA